MRSSVLVTLAWWAASAAQSAPPGTTASVRATAEATASAKPDRARVVIGVVTRAATAQTAAAENARQVAAVLAALRQTLGPGAGMQTVNYSLAPDYRYPREGGTPSLAGYTATNGVEVTVDDMDYVARVIDTAAQSGANTVQSLRFLLRDERALREQALKKATVEARARAEAMASAAGLRVVRIVSIEEGAAPPVRPVREIALVAGPAPATPVEPGTLEIRATVTVTVAAQ